MRISDWSSDVCSSDLREIGEAEEGARQRILVAVRIDLEDRIARLAGRPLRDDRELDEALIALFAVEIVVIIAGQREIFEVRAAAEHLDPVVRAEIGRAAGRERVCQYV